MAGMTPTDFKATGTDKRTPLKGGVLSVRFVRAHTPRGHVPDISALSALSGLNRNHSTATDCYQPRAMLNRRQHGGGRLGSLDRAGVATAHSLIHKFFRNFWEFKILPTKKQLQAPSHLSLATRRWFVEVSEAYQLEPHHVRLLTLAGEAWDLGERARKALESGDITYTDRFGTPRIRPEVGAMHDARQSFGRLVDQLDLDRDLVPAAKARKAR